MSTVSTFTVGGMSCRHCVSSVTSAVTAIDGVTDVAVDLERGIVAVTGSRSLDAEAVATAIEAAGYEVTR
jgi:copper ion binding protein